MTIYKDITQGSDDWLKIRKGRPTASRFDDILTSTGALSKSSTAYIRELIAECFCPDFQEWAGNKYTDRGQAMEPESREAFAKHTGLTTEQVGFVLSDDGVCGCSPDSFIMVDGKPVAGLEMKNPAPKTHVGYVLDGVLPSDYKQQVHGSMAITGLSEWHFWSYFPGLKPFHFIVQRDSYTEKVEWALKEFITNYRSAMAEAVPRLKAG